MKHHLKFERCERAGNVSQQVM